jgi:hypothetical protein
MCFQKGGSPTVSLLTAALLSVGVGHARGEPAKQTVAAAAPVPQLANEELLKNMQCMEQRLKALEAKLKAQSATPGDTSEGAQGVAEPPKPFPMRTVRVPENGQQTKTTPSSEPNPKPPAEGAQRGGTTRPATESTPEKPGAKTAVDPCLPTPTPTSPSPTRPATGAPPLLPPLPAATGAGEQPLLPPLPAGSTTPAGAGPEKKSILGLADSPVLGLSIGAYGEIKYGSIQNPNAAGQWQNGFDAHRLVLLPTYAITPNIIFNAEIEFEHGGIAFDSDDKMHGSVDVEQIFVDFIMVDWLNWRSPGIDLVPIGYINQHHEPTQFYSVKRPELYNGLIPSTWRVPASSIYGTIADGIKYQLQMSSSLEDYGDDFGLRTDANTVPLVDPITGLSIPYAAGITGLEALGLSRPVVGDFRQLSNVIAYAGKLDFTPPFLPGLGWSVSAYYTPNTTPRGAHDNFGNPLGAPASRCSMRNSAIASRIPGWSCGESTCVPISALPSICAPTTTAIPSTMWAGSCTATRGRSHSTYRWGRF